MPISSFQILSCRFLKALVDGHTRRTVEQGRSQKFDLGDMFLFFFWGGV